MAIETFGFLAVAFMVIMYAFEKRSHVYVLGFAASCAAASLYALLIHSWPFAAAEGVRPWSRCGVGGGSVLVCDRSNLYLACRL